VLDSQTVKAPFAEMRGYDGGKRIVGRKRHVAVDTDGRLLMVNLAPADVSYSAGAQTILAAIRKRWPWLKHLFADAGYDRTKLMDKAAFLDFVVEIVCRSDKVARFEVIPRRWVVELTFSWMIRWRRLVRGCEKRLDVSEAMIHVPWAPCCSAASPIGDCQTDSETRRLKQRGLRLVALAFALDADQRQAVRSLGRDIPPPTTPNGGIGVRIPQSVAHFALKESRYRRRDRNLAYSPKVHGVWARLHGFRKVPSRVPNDVEALLEPLTGHWLGGDGCH
jgi:transposase